MHPRAGMRPRRVQFPQIWIDSRSTRDARAPAFSGRSAAASDGGVLQAQVVVEGAEARVLGCAVTEGMLRFKKVLKVG
jgi:hypothetical protein